MSHKNLILFLSTVFSIYQITYAVLPEGIISGYPAQAGMFPYQVAVQAKKNYCTYSKVICGGSILTANLILSAGHCFRDNGTFERLTYSIIAGTHNLNDQIFVYADIELIFLLPYHLTLNDIALLKLKKELDINRNWFLQRVYLPNGQVVVTNTLGVATGFGITEVTLYINATSRKRRREDALTSPLLQFGEYRILPDFECEHRIIYSDKDKHLCAFMIPTDPEKTGGLCSGDSGGPLVVNQNVIAGIISKNTVNCDDILRPSLFTRVDGYLEFIEGIVNGRPTPETLIFWNPEHIRKRQS